MHHFDKNFLTRQQRNIDMYVHISAVGTREVGGDMSPDLAYRCYIHNPNSIMGADYVNHMVLAHPDFQISLRLSLRLYICLALPVCAMFSLGYVTMYYYWRQQQQ